MKRLLAVAVALATPTSSTLAHHSRAEYDASATLELRGAVERVIWANPHVRLSLNVIDEDGESTLWQLEGMDVSRLDRAGLPHDLIKAGSTIVVAGDPSTRRENRMFVRHVLLPDNTELILEARAAPRWPEADRVFGSEFPFVRSAEPVEAEQVTGIFRVWFPLDIQPPPAFASDPPFTDEARVAHAAYDPVDDDPVTDCLPPGIPRVMTINGWAPIEFVDEGEAILIRLEPFALVRRIEMKNEIVGDRRPPTPLGYSVGRWDRQTLVVTTTNVSWPHFDLYGFRGAPQSPASEITERFSISEDETQLTYSITANDPSTFTRPVTAERYRIYEYRPGHKLMPYEECTRPL